MQLHSRISYDKVILSEDKEVEKMAKLYVTDMRTGYQTEPLGIECEQVNFSWRLEGGPGVEFEQSAYKLTLFSEEKKLLDTTKTILSSSSVGISSPFLLEEGQVYFWQVTVLSTTGLEIISPLSRFETALSHNQKWLDIPFIQTKEESECAVTFCWKAESKKDTSKVQSARLYVAALGVYEIAINGSLLGEEKERIQILNPGYGNQLIDQSYQTYDISEYLKQSGELSLACTVGKGWYHGMAPGAYQPAIKILAVITDDQGEKLWLSASPADTLARTDNQIKKNSLYYGEDINSDFYTTEALSLFPRLDSTNCLKVVTGSYEGRLISRPSLTGYALISKMLYPKSIHTYLPLTGECDLQKVYELSISERKMTKPHQELKIPANYRVIIDFGQNTTAIPYLKFFSENSNSIRLRFSEILNDGRPWDQLPDSHTGDGPRNTLYRKNYRQARAQTIYQTSGGKNETYRSHLTFFGYRYLEITAKEPFTLLACGSIPLSSMTNIRGQVITNNKNVNRLLENTRWSQSSNYFTTATDCPQRDERSFWSGDAQVFIQTGLYNYDAVAFMGDLQQIINDNTMIKGYCPMVVDQIEDEYFSHFCAGWSDALVVNAWTLYLNTGDSAFLKKSWPALQKYYRYLESHERKEHEAPLFGDRNCGDWLSFQGTSVAMMGDYYYLYCLSLLMQVAELIAPTNYPFLQRKYEKVKERFYVNHVVGHDDDICLKSGDLSSVPYQFFGYGENGKSGVWEDNSQTALLWYLKLKLPRSSREYQRVVALLVANIENADHDSKSIRSLYDKKTLAVGFLGINILAPILSEIGRDDLAYDLLLQDKKPSWLFEVKAGATTIWERWNSYDPDKGFGNSEMNSYNHYAYGAICQWIFSSVLGVAPVKELPGFKEIELRPMLDTGEKYNDEVRIDDVAGFVETFYGRVAVKWQYLENRFVYQVKLPQNTRAKFYLPSSLRERCSNQEIFEFFTETEAYLILDSGTWQITFDGEYLSKIKISNGE